MLRICFSIPFVKAIISSIYRTSSERLAVNKQGLSFRNPVGLAAGFDKDAILFQDFEAFDFGFIEVGTVTPLAQNGNPKPRMFRLKKNNALINRMGFNNAGLEAMAMRLKKKETKMMIGANIGKNKDTPNENAADDYLKCFRKLQNYADYFVVNVSSPNTPGLRALQEKEPLKAILAQLVDENRLSPFPKPLLLKIAPDLTDEQLHDIAEIVTACQLNGVVATNTTIDRSNLAYTQAEIAAFGNGGLSGSPLTQRATSVIKKLRIALGEEKLIIGVGGIMNENDAIEKLKAGADVIQLYTGFIYEGPGLIKRINKAVKQWKANESK